MLKTSSVHTVVYFAETSLALDTFTIENTRKIFYIIFQPAEILHLCIVVLNGFLKSFGGTYLSRNYTVKIYY